MISLVLLSCDVEDHQQGRHTNRTDRISLRCIETKDQSNNVKERIILVVLDRLIEVIIFMIVIGPLFVWNSINEYFDTL